MCADGVFEEQKIFELVHPTKKVATDDQGNLVWIQSSNRELKAKKTKLTLRQFLNATNLFEELPNITAKIKFNLEGEFSQEQSKKKIVHHV